jgi:hypothetical protein
MHNKSNGKKTKHARYKTHTPSSLGMNLESKRGFRNDSALAILVILRLLLILQLNGKATKRFASMSAL